MRKFIKCVSVVVVAVCLFAGCSKTPQEELAGRWEVEGKGKFDYLEFFEDGTYVSDESNYEGDYSISGDRIKLEGVLVDSKTYTYEVSGDKLTLYNNDGEVAAEYNREK